MTESSPYLAAAGLISDPAIVRSRDVNGPMAAQHASRSPSRPSAAAIAPPPASQKWSGAQFPEEPTDAVFPQPFDAASQTHV